MIANQREFMPEAGKILNENNIHPTIADARFAKPLDTKLIDLLIENHIDYLEVQVCRNNQLVIKKLLELKEVFSY